jgi:penicillin-binding protein
MKRLYFPCLSFLSLFCLLILMLLILPGCQADLHQAEEAAKSFLEFWSAGDYQAMYELLDQESRNKYSPSSFIGYYTDLEEAINLSGVEYQLEKAAETDANRVTFSYSARLQSDTVGAIPAPNTIILTRKAKGEPWQVSWNPGQIFPEMTDNCRLVLKRLVPRRGIILDRYNRPLVQYRQFKEVGAVPGRFDDQSRFARSVAPLLGLSAAEVEAKLNQPWVREGLFVPLAVLSPEEEHLAEQLLKIPGVMINFLEKRYYPQGKLLAQVIGYLGEISPQELEERKGQGYSPGDIVGKMGLEAALEETLGGRYGYTIQIVDGEGNEKAIIAGREMEPGRDIRLTIDLDLQRAAQEALSTKTGSVVVLNPENGQILAMASSPSFDPNQFVFGLSAEQWQQLEQDPGKPLLNRSTQGLYPPGSSFKVFTAAAALDAGVLDPREVFKIEGSRWQKSAAWGNYYVQRVRGDIKELNLKQAMAYSDNIYFAQVGLALGEKRFLEYGERFGFNESIPFTLPVAKSRLSRDDQIRSEIQLADSSYGQGEVLTTPLHLALINSAIYNGGRMPQPKLLMEAGETVFWKENIISPAAAKAVTESLAAEVKEAPGGGSYTIVGKTGTAQVGNAEGNICWYASFVKEGLPPAVVVAMVEGGTWASQEAVPLALQVWEQYAEISRSNP